MMKHITLVLVCLFFGSLLGDVDGQERIVKELHSKQMLNTYEQGVLTSLRSKPEETVLYPTFNDECSSTVFAFGISDNWGFFAGNNGYGDAEKAQILTFNNSDNFSVIGAIAWFAPAGVVNDGELFAKVYALNGDGTPGELVSTSLPVKASELNPPSDTSVEASFFIFEGEEIKDIMGPEFLLSIDFNNLYESADTVGLYTTEDGCGSGMNSWELWNDGTWATMSAAWEAELDFLLGAVVSFPESTSVDQFISHKGIQLYPAFPNPAKESIQIKYGVENIENARIDIYSLDGKLVQKIQEKSVNPGEHFVQVDISDYPSGQYLYQITTNRGTIASKFTKQ